MLFYHSIQADETILAVWKMEETEDELRNQLSEKTLSEKKFQQLSSDKRKIEWLSVRLLLKNTCLEEKIIAYEQNGKPFLLDNSFNISISHTKGFVALLLHPTRNVGIDIEQMTDKVLKLKERFMTKDELKYSSFEEEKIQVLLHWSAKETLFKIIPQAEITFNEHLHIAPFQVKRKGFFSAIETKTPNRQKFEINYQVFPEFVLTWTSK